MNSEKKYNRIEELISEFLDGKLTNEQQNELFEALQADPEIRHRVLNLFMDNCVLEILHAIEKPDSFVQKVLLHAKYLDTGESFTDRVATAAFNQDLFESGSVPDKQRIEQVRRYAEQQLKAYLDEQEKLRKQNLQKQSPQFSFDFDGIIRKVQFFLGTIKKAVVASAITAIVILFVFLGIHHIIANRVVATLGQTVNARWDEVPDQNELRPGWIGLRQGYASIRFNKGAEVILQAPCVFELQSSNRMFMQSGWITAKVPEQARGFTVNTTGSSIVDFGTEFGLLAGTGNSAEVHVFEGKVGLKSTKNTRSTQHELEKGDAATIDITGNIDRSRVINRPNLFIHSLPSGTGFGIPGKRLSLADIVGGGNGLNTGVIGRGLDPTTGQITKTRTFLKKDCNEFNEVASLMFVDGVFVPDANDGEVIISSTGIVFDNCPATQGICYESINNGAVFRAGSLELHEGRINGRSYCTIENPSIGMHPNSGVTFDLDKIRSAMPEISITRFKSTCGISDSMIDYFDREWDPNQVKMDFWVLVDGKVRFNKKLAAASSMTELIDIPLNPEDRFLSLSSTHPDDYLYCWGMFVEPMLELKVKAETITKSK